MQEEVAHHYATKPPILPLCLHREKEASARKVQNNHVLLVQMQKTWTVLPKPQASSNEYRDVGFRTGPKARWCAHTMDCMLQLYRATALPRLFAGSNGLHEIVKHEGCVYCTSHIHTSNTEAATSYAVSPQLFRTSGSAACLDNKYVTTGRCPFEAAFTGESISRSDGDKNEKRLTERSPASLIAKVDTTHPTYFSRSATTFTEPSYNIQIALERE